MTEAPPMPTRRRFAQGLALACAPGLAAGPVRAQGLNRTPRLIVGSATGGPADLQGRALADAMRRAGGPLTVVDNRPGAAGRLAVQALKQAAPDGSTLLLAAGWQLSLAPQTEGTQTVDPFTELMPIGGLCVQEFALVVGPGTTARTLAEFAALARRSPGGELCASAGVGSMGHLIGVMFERSAGIQLQSVPYKGAAPALQDVQAGHVAAYAGALGDMVRLHKDGLLRVLGTSGPQRSKFLPDVPTFKESGYAEVQATDWTALFAPAGVPAAQAATLTRLLRSAMGDRALLAMLERMGVEARFAEPEQVSARLRADFAAMREHVRVYRLSSRN